LFAFTCCAQFFRVSVYGGSVNDGSVSSGGGTIE
jgi:hypothetical protein